MPPKFRILFRVSVGLLFYFPSAGYAEPEPLAGATLSLERAASLAVEHNFELADRRMRVLFPELQVEIEQADFRWRLRPAFNVERSTRDVVLTRLEGRVTKEFTSGALFQGRAEWTTREEGNDAERVELRVEQPLFQQFGPLVALRNVDSADYQLQLARLGLRRETESLILRVVSAYASCRNEHRTIERETAAVGRASDLARLVKVKQRQGRSTAVDVLEMEMLRQEAILRLRRAEERLLRFRADLAELLGRVTAQLPDLEPVALAEWEPPSLADAEAFAREHRVERYQALADYENARRKLKLERREMYPDIRLFADWRPVDTQNEGDWFVGMSGGRELDLDLTRVRIQQQEVRVRAALIRIASVEVRISREVQQAFSRLKIAETEMALADTRAELAEKRLRLARGLFPSGRVGALRLREAEEEWSAARNALSDLKLERVVARYGFRYALGMLAE